MTSGWHTWSATAEGAERPAHRSEGGRRGRYPPPPRGEAPRSFHDDSGQGGVGEEGSPGQVSQSQPGPRQCRQELGGPGVSSAFLPHSPPHPSIGRNSGLTLRETRGTPLGPDGTDRRPASHTRAGEGRTRGRHSGAFLAVLYHGITARRGLRPSKLGAHPHILRLPNALSPSSSDADHRTQRLPLSVNPPHPRVTLYSGFLSTG